MERNPYIVEKNGENILVMPSGQILQLPDLLTELKYSNGAMLIREEEGWLEEVEMDMGEFKAISELLVKLYGFEAPENAAQGLPPHTVWMDATGSGDAIAALLEKRGVNVRFLPQSIAKML